MDLVLLGIGRGKSHNLPYHGAQVMIREPKLQRTSEVDQSLYHTIEPADFVADDIHMPHRRRIGSVQFITQELQMHDDGVNRILDLMSDTAGQPAHICKTA